MKSFISTNFDEFDNLDFVPTIIIGFYQAGEEKLFSQQYTQLKKRFPDADIIGSSSESNIENKIPHISMDKKNKYTYMCLNMDKQSYKLEILNECVGQSFEDCNNQQALSNEQNRYGIIVFATRYSKCLEQMVSTLQQDIREKNLFGAIAGSDIPGTNKGTVFYNGKYISSGALIWFINQRDYLLSGISVHDFNPIGFELEITKADDYNIVELEGHNALDVVEDMIGTLDKDTISSFEHPFFVATKQGMSYEKLPLCSIRSVNRKNKNIKLFRKVSAGNYLKIAIPLNRKEQEEKIDKLSRFFHERGVAFLFLGVAYKGHWNELEHIYLMRFAKNINMPFIGFHSLGEIGPLSEDTNSILLNQTLTLAVLSKR